MKLVRTILNQLKNKVEWICSTWDEIKQTETDCIKTER